MVQHTLHYYKYGQERFSCTNGVKLELDTIVNQEPDIQVFVLYDTKA